MRKSRYQKGSVKKQRGRWVAMWWVDHSRKSRVIGLVKNMTKSEARAVVDRIVSEANAKREEDRAWRFGEFVAEVYFRYYSRKWKASTRVNNMNRVSIQLVDGLGSLELSSFRRDGLQDLLDEKTRSGLSFSTVDHLRWDLKQIFDMALAEGLVMRNPALLLFTPKEAAKPVRRVMTIKEVQICFAVLGQRERLIAKLAIMTGMRPGEIFALTWSRLTSTYVDIRQRVYRGAIDTPKTDQSIRQAALPEGLLREIEAWRSVSIVTRDDAWVFPSERMTPMSKDNCWNRNLKPKLESVGMGWANFLVMRRTHAT
ncbi:MAG TPA: tyrosine-type recombinase/integrase, partial [Edaphobacter sp.]|nr:tyrosine-type recombinase/integrase [Edaphobacter sp.]